jgi:hypothetical protein
MPFRRPLHVLPISSVGLICGFFSLGSIASSLTGGFDLHLFFVGSTASPLTGGFDLHLFLPRIDHISTGIEPLIGSPSRLAAWISRGFDSIGPLHTRVADAAAGRSLTIPTVDHLIIIGATTPPPARATKWRGGRPHEPPRLPETELPTSRSRRSSNLRMRHVRLPLADFRESVHAPDKQCRPVIPLRRVPLH